MNIEIENASFLKQDHLYSFQDSTGRSIDLLWVEKLIYQPMGLVIQNLKIEDESADYGAADFEINQRRIKFRVGKITPTKTGQFVTFWKRIGKGPILPYDLDDPFDLLVVNASSTNHFGQFIFPKHVLGEKGLLSTGEKEGKRAMRIYPPWDKADNTQAKKTQAWQTQYFFEIQEKIDIDFARMQYLLSL